jgi:hypothetical protein
MRTYNLFALTTAFCVAVSSAAQATTLFFDFGDSAQQTGGNYNDITPAQDPIFNAIDSTGNPSGIGLTTSGFNPGSNLNGTLTPGAPADLFSPQATRDNLFGHEDSPFNQPAPLPLGILQLTGLNPSLTYNFTFHAGRLGVTDNRETAYEIIGTNSDTGLLDSSNNTSNIVTVTGIVPTALGGVTINVSPGTNNTNTSGFFYLGAMRIESIDIPEPATSVLLLLSGCLMVGRSRSRK